MKIRVEVDENTLRDLVDTYLRERLGPAFSVQAKDIRIEVKSAEDCRAEWELGRFRAVLEIKE